MSNSKTQKIEKGLQIGVPTVVAAGAGIYAIKKAYDHIQQEKREFKINKSLIPQEYNNDLHVYDEFLTRYNNYRDILNNNERFSKTPIVDLENRINAIIGQMTTNERTISKSSTTDDVKQELTNKNEELTKELGPLDIIIKFRKDPQLYNNFIDQYMKTQDYLGQSIKKLERYKILKYYQHLSDSSKEFVAHWIQNPKWYKDSIKKLEFISVDESSTPSQYFTLDHIYPLTNSVEKPFTSSFQKGILELQRSPNLDNYLVLKKRLIELEDKKSRQIPDEHYNDLITDFVKSQNNLAKDIARTIKTLKSQNLLTDEIQLQHFYSDIDIYVTDKVHDLKENEFKRGSQYKTLTKLFDLRTEVESYLQQEEKTGVQEEKKTDVQEKEQAGVQEEKKTGVQEEEQKKEDTLEVQELKQEKIPYDDSFAKKVIEFQRRIKDYNNTYITSEPGVYRLNQAKDTDKLGKDLADFTREYLRVPKYSSFILPDANGLLWWQRDLILSEKGMDIGLFSYLFPIRNESTRREYEYSLNQSFDRYFSDPNYGGYEFYSNPKFLIPEKQEMSEEEFKALEKEYERQRREEETRRQVEKGQADALDLSKSMSELGPDISDKAKASRQNLVITSSAINTGDNSLKRIQSSRDFEEYGEGSTPFDDINSLPQIQEKTQSLYETQEQINILKNRLDRYSRGQLRTTPGSIDIITKELKRLEDVLENKQIELDTLKESYGQEHMRLMDNPIKIPSTFGDDRTLDQKTYTYDSSNPTLYRPDTKSYVYRPSKGSGLFLEKKIYPQNVDIKHEGVGNHITQVQDRFIRDRSTYEETARRLNRDIETQKEKDDLLNEQLRSTKKYRDNDKFSRLREKPGITDEQLQNIIEEKNIFSKDFITKPDGSLLSSKDITDLIKSNDRNISSLERSLNPLFPGRTISRDRTQEIRTEIKRLQIEKKYLNSLLGFRNTFTKDKDFEQQILIKQREITGDINRTIGPNLSILDEYSDLDILPYDKLTPLDKTKKQILKYILQSGRSLSSEQEQKILSDLNNPKSILIKDWETRLDPNDTLFSKDDTGNPIGDGVTERQLKSGTAEDIYDTLFGEQRGVFKTPDIKITSLPDDISTLAKRNTLVSRHRYNITEILQNPLRHTENAQVFAKMNGSINHVLNEPRPPSSRLSSRITSISSRPQQLPTGNFRQTIDGSEEEPSQILTGGDDLTAPLLR